MLGSVVQRVCWPLIFVAAVVLGAVPAAQDADGDMVKLGNNNTESHTTFIGVIGAEVGTGSNGTGVQGSSHDGWGVTGITSNSLRAGVRGLNYSGGNAVYGTSNGSARDSVFGDNIGGGYGVVGRTNGSKPAIVGD